MKTLIAATLVLFSISTSASALQLPNVKGLNVQKVLKSKNGKKFLSKLQELNGQEGGLKGKLSGMQGMGGMGGLGGLGGFGR